MSDWLFEMFGVDKPVIAMAHLPALPGTPRYDAKRGVDYIAEHVIQDVEVLLDEGVDGILFCNEDDRPYTFEAGIEQIAAMARVVAEARPKHKPFGVDFLWDPMAAMAIAHATGGVFMREVLTGTYESDMGLWSPNAGKLLRFRRQIDGANIRVLFNVVPEFASPIGGRSVIQRARSTIVSSLADGLLISGPMAGSEPDFELISEMKKAVSGTPVLLNTGAKIENIGAYLPVVDGVIVGSGLKVDGYTWNKVDRSRVQRFMERVSLVRNHK